MAANKRKYSQEQLDEALAEQVQKYETLKEVFEDSNRIWREELYRIDAEKDEWKELAIDMIKKYPEGEQAEWLYNTLSIIAKERSEVAGRLAIKKWDEENGKQDPKQA